MTDIIISISLYLVAAILLGFTFGWFIAKAMFKEKYDDQIEALTTSYDTNQESIALQYEKQNELLVRNSTTIDELKHFVKTKDEMISKLTFELSNQEEKLRASESEHEKEIDAFLYERVDTTQKYKALLAQLSEEGDLSDTNEDSSKENSWLGKVFKN